MVAPLGKAGDGHAANDARADNSQRKRAAMRSVVGNGQALALEHRFVLDLLFNSDGVGAAMKAGDHVALASHPFDVIGSGAVHRCIKKWLSETAHVDHDGEITLSGHGAEPNTKVPSDLRVEARQHEILLLQCNLFQVLAPSHGHVSFRVSAILRGRRSERRKILLSSARLPRPDPAAGQFRGVRRWAACPCEYEGGATRTKYRRGCRRCR